MGSGGFEITNEEARLAGYKMEGVDAGGNRRGDEFNPNTA